jgi:hypothetical protein
MCSAIGSSSRFRKATLSFSRPNATGSAALRLMAVLTVALLALCGCATQTSDMPWNSPQTWEGSPTIPGFSGQ